MFIVCSSNHTLQRQFSRFHARPHIFINKLALGTWSGRYSAGRLYLPLGFSHVLNLGWVDMEVRPILINFVFIMRRETQYISMAIYNQLAPRDPRNKSLVEDVLGNWVSQYCLQTHHIMGTLQSVLSIITMLVGKVFDDDDEDHHRHADYYHTD